MRRLTLQRERKGLTPNTYLNLNPVIRSSFLTTLPTLLHVASVCNLPPPVSRREMIEYSPSKPNTIGTVVGLDPKLGGEAGGSTPNEFFGLSCMPLLFSGMAEATLVSLSAPTNSFARAHHPNVSKKLSSRALNVSAKSVRCW